MNKASALDQLRNQRSYNRQQIALEIIADDSDEMTAEDMRELAQAMFAMNDEDED